MTHGLPWLNLYINLYSDSVKLMVISKTYWTLPFLMIWWVSAPPRRRLIIYVHLQHAVAAFGNVCLSDRCSRSLIHYSDSKSYLSIGMFNLTRPQCTINFVRFVYNKRMEVLLKTSIIMMFFFLWQSFIWKSTYLRIRCKLLLKLVNSDSSFPQHCHGLE